MNWKHEKKNREKEKKKSRQRSEVQNSNGWKVSKSHTHNVTHLIFQHAFDFSFDSFDKDK